MFQVNSYFEGKVQSQGFENGKGRQTVGLMAKGEYEFGTSSKEYMTLVSGSWKIKLPGSSEFVNYEVGSTFEVEANEKFQLIVEEDSAYLCLYV